MSKPKQTLKVSIELGSIDYVKSLMIKRLVENLENSKEIKSTVRSVIKQVYNKNKLNKLMRDTELSVVREHTKQLILNDRLKIMVDDSVEVSINEKAIKAIIKTYCSEIEAKASESKTLQCSVEKYITSAFDRIFTIKMESRISEMVHVHVCRSLDLLKKDGLI